MDFLDEKSSTMYSDKRRRSLTTKRDNDEFEHNHRNTAFPPIRMGSWRRDRSVSQEFADMVLNPVSSVSSGGGSRSAIVGVSFLFILYQKLNVIIEIEFSSGYSFGTDSHANSYTLS